MHPAAEEHVVGWDGWNVPSLPFFAGGASSAIA